MLSRPRTIAGLIGGQDGSPRPWVVRLLGGRILAESVLTLVRPQRRVLLTAAGVDAVHGTSMLLAAAARPTHRRPALVAAAEAFGAAVVGGWAGRRAAV